MEAFLAVVGSGLTVPGLPEADFWRLVGKFSSRGFRAGPRRVVCEHILDAYAPSLGDSGNRELIREDLKDVAHDVALIVATSFDAWPLGASDIDCLACGASRVYLTEVPNESDVKVRRAQYLAQNASNPGGLSDVGAELFPQTVFHPNAWSGVATLGGPPAEQTARLVHHLSVLNDIGPTIWSEQANNWDRIAHFGSQGVEASPENSSVHKNKAAMSARTFKFGSRERVCEWHTKLQPNRDRIYFEIADGKVWVGSIIMHL